MASLEECAERLFALSPEAIVVLDNNANIVFRNAAGVRLLGKQIERWEEPALQRVLAGEPVYFRASLPEGNNSRQFEVSAWPIPGSSGSIEGAAFRIRQHSSRWQQMFETLFENSQAAASLSALDGRLLAANRKMADMLGFDSPADVLRELADHFYLPGEREEALARLKKAGVLRDARGTMVRKDGRPVFVIGSLTLLTPLSPEEEPLILASIVDDSARIQAELAESQSEMRFAEFLHHLPGVAFIKDSDGRYVFCTESAIQGTGRPAAEILGKTDGELWPQSYSSQIHADDRKVLAEGKPIRVSENLPGPQGIRYWTVYKFPMPDANGDLTLVGGFATDDTERQKLEARLNQAEKMEAIGRLAGGIAHDFNNLLTVISGYGQMLLDGVNRSLPHERLGIYVKELLSASKRAGNLTDQLLSFARRKPVRLARVDLNEVVREVRNMLDHLIGEHIDLTLDLSPDPCFIDGDQGQIEQVLVNLVVNSRDAMPPSGGNIHIRTAISASGAGTKLKKGVVLEVADNGSGMEDEVKQHLFEPFFTSKPKGKGTGLGLSTVYGIVSQFGGEITLDSEPSRGTTFQICFPSPTLPPGAPQDRPAESEKPLKEKPGRGDELILVVEDDTTVREMVRSMLERFGYHVLTASSGQQALDVFGEKGGQIDLVLTDVIMPQMSGKDLVDALLILSPSLRFLYMTGYTDNELATQGFPDPSRLVLQKPFTADGLAKRVREVLDQARSDASSQRS
jgi:two-component system cell cycle sensor histidine kinase/response regulator CckA